MLDFARRHRSMQRLMLEECANSKSAEVRRRVRELTQTFAAALRRAWAWVCGANDREAARQAWATRPHRIVRLAPMDVSPIRRSLSSTPYGSAEAARRGYTTAVLGR